MRTEFDNVVKMWEGPWILPTYPMEAPDKIPLFFRPEEVQLAEKHVYPYPFYGVKSGEKIDKEYTAIFLENEYLKLCITPELGGRLYYALDKTNGYQIVYKNGVVKPALIGMIGAWTSGGVEWNTPHHHRATSNIKVDYRLVENEDGSKTVWVGEYEKRSQTRWLAGVSLEPGIARARIDFKSVNVTPYSYPVLYFANVAVHVHERYQFIFPPDVDMMNFHYVTEYTRWPVLNQVYQSTDYTHGEDLSWWAAVKQPVSFFVTKTDHDFMAGIDHDKGAGIAMVGDRRIFKGKKLWNWGKNEVQEVWDQKLTDEDGPYAELMMGFYSDNQPDYNFVAPYETKYGTLYIYGIKGLEDIKEANEDCAINMALEKQRLSVQVNATRPRRQAKVLVTRKDDIVLQETVDLCPTVCFQTGLDVPGDASLMDFKIAVYSGDGAELIHYQRQPSREEPFPETYRDPLDPQDYSSSQDLFFEGLKLEQFGNTNFDFMKYYHRALELEPNHVLTNTQIGQVYLKRREYALAEAHLKRAADVVTGNHKKAQDATSLYYLGVCHMKQGRVEDALELLYRSTWSCAWTSPGYTLVAQLEASRDNWKRALEAAQRACTANTQNIEALLAKALILRHMGRFDEARTTVEKCLAVDPLCFVAMNEWRWLSESAGEGKGGEEGRETLMKHLRDEPYNYIETAARYSAFGLFEEAEDILSLAADSDMPSLNTYPMVFYHLGMYQAMAGKPREAEASLRMATSLPTDLCFPYGDESVKALRFAIAWDERDSSAHYLLGCALADCRHEEAIQCWTLAARQDENKAILYRNMAYIQANHLGQLSVALDNIMKAISLDPSEPRYFAEAGLYMSYAQLGPKQLTAFLAKYGKMAKTMKEIQLMEIQLSIFKGEFDRAIELLESLEYHVEEGANFNPHVYWFDAHLHKGRTQMERGDHEGAKRSFLRAMEFPANLEAERNGKIGIAYYDLGLNSKGVDDEEAKAYFQKMVDYTYSKGWGAGDFPELGYYKALASLELGRDRAEVNALFQALIDEGEQRFDPAKDSRHITVTVEPSHSGRRFLIERELRCKSLRVLSCYLQGLGYMGLGEEEKGRSFFRQAVELDPLAIDPKWMLNATSCHEPNKGG